jgi:hypothetical protein|tara:strand:- start:1956 stop:2195 length:240 start_codon:yes stop_codon:yes gene_type:complete
MISKTMLDQRLLQLLTTAQKQPYLFELMRNPVSIVNEDIPSDCEQWLELEDERIIDQLPSGSFQVEYSQSTKGYWVYQA